MKPTTSQLASQLREVLAGDNDFNEGPLHAPWVKMGKMTDRAHKYTDVIEQAAEKSATEWGRAAQHSADTLKKFKDELHAAGANRLKKQAQLFEDRAEKMRKLAKEMKDFF